jgi:pteridine reductase
MAILWPPIMLAQHAAASADPRQAAVQQWALWMLVLIILLLLAIIAMLSAILRRRRLERFRRPPEGPAEPRVDAWVESAKRLAVVPPANVDAQAAKADALSGVRPVALVTGGARRVGRATCLALAKAGCDIVLTYHASRDEAMTLADELRAIGVSAVTHEVNLLDLGAVELFAGFLADSLPRLDVLVHNASVYSPTPLHDLTVQETLQQVSINAVAPLILTARLAPLLRESSRPGGASVVAMVDILAMGTPRRDFVAYSMSKAALVEMVRSCARDLAPHVRVNGVAPGVVAWPESGDESSPEAQERYLRRVPLGRPGTPEEAAQVVRWLALDATYVTGEVIRVDGGRGIT